MQFKQNGKMVSPFLTPGSGVKSCPTSRCYGKGVLDQLGKMGQECPMSLPLLSYHSLEKSVSPEQLLTEPKCLVTWTFNIYVLI